jgi:diadenosine tetraphosphate (Ap4A) HIT family hydrolase
MPTAIHRKVALARAGQLPSAICRMPSGWLVLAETQPVDGYCLLLSDPVARDINALAEAERAAWWRDVGRVGDALIAVAGADRVNYETWGNVDRALHTHVTPRYLTEALDKRGKTPREAYDLSQSRAFTMERDGDLLRRLRAWLAP